MEQSVAQTLIDTLARGDAHPPDNLAHFSVSSLDEEEHAFHTYSSRLLVTLRRARNAKVHAQMIVDDLLAVIMLSSMDSSLDPDRHALNISHVCHRWRELALSIPELWTHVNVLNQRLTPIFLDRSGTARLNLRLSDQRPFSNVRLREQAAIIAACIPRTRSLAMDLSSPVNVLLMINIFKRTPLQPLEGLDLFLSHPGSEIDAGALWMNPLHMPEIFSKNFSHLKTLRLRGNSFDWDSPCIGGLIELVLDSPFDAPTLAQIMGILSRSPDLEVLQLRRLHGLYYTPNGTDALFRYDGNAASLPHLRNLVIEAICQENIPFIRNLFSHLHLSRLQSLIICCAGLTMVECATIEPRLFDTIPSTVLHFSSMRHVALAVGAPRDGEHVGSTIVGNRRRQGAITALSYQPSDHDLFLYDGTHVDKLACVALRRILLEMTSVERLDLWECSWNLVDADSNMDVFAIMPNLSELTLSGSPTWGSHDVSDFVKRLTGRITLSLKIFRLNEVVCDGRLLVDLVAGAGLHELHMSHCAGVEEQHVRAVRERQVLVTWTGEWCGN